MAIVQMNTANPLGQRPFGAMGGMDGTWDLAEQDRSWIVRDTESAPIEHMRVPPELLEGVGMAVPVAAVLYRPAPLPVLSDRVMPPDAMRIFYGSEVAPNPIPTRTTVQSLLTPGGSTPPVVATAQPQEPSFAQIVPQGSPIVAIGPGSSTQNLVPVSVAAEQAAPGLTSVLAAGQPPSSAVPVDTSWFTDPAQEIVPGFPNWGLLAAVVAAAMWLSSKGKR